MREPLDIITGCRCLGWNAGINVMKHIASLLRCLRVRLHEPTSSLVSLGHPLGNFHRIQEVTSPTLRGAQELWLGRCWPLSRHTFTRWFTPSTSFDRHGLRLSWKWVVAQLLQIGQLHVERSLEARGDVGAAGGLRCHDRRLSHLRLTFTDLSDIIKINVFSRWSESHVNIREGSPSTCFQWAGSLGANLMEERSSR